jgi:hypothetical protein
VPKKQIIPIFLQNGTLTSSSTCAVYGLWNPFLSFPWKVYPLSLPSSAALLILCQALLPGSLSGESLLIETTSCWWRLQKLTHRHHSAFQGSPMRGADVVMKYRQPLPASFGRMCILRLKVQATAYCYCEFPSDADSPSFSLPPALN